MFLLVFEITKSYMYLLLYCRFKFFSESFLESELLETANDITDTKITTNITSFPIVQLELEEKKLIFITCTSNFLNWIS